jgi:hypothetical protein
MNVWHTLVENKCKFFSWLVLQNKLWTADRILRHGGQANAICQLCYTHSETALHMLAECPDAIAVWRGHQEWLGFSF